MIEDPIALMLQNESVDFFNVWIPHRFESLAMDPRDRFALIFRQCQDENLTIILFPQRLDLQLRFI